MPQKLRPQAETLSGSPQPNFSGFSYAPIKARRAPTAADTGYDIGQVWIDKVLNASYVLTSVAAGSANWVATGGGATAVATINNLAPTAGNITIAGTANQVGVASAGSTVTLSLPAAVTAPGSLATTTTLAAGTALSSGTTITAGTSITATAGNITATLGDIVATNGNVLISGAARQLRVEGGAVTDFIGQATLAAGTVTILNTNIAAADKIFVQRQGINGSTALGVFDVAITPATSFSITARNPTDATTQVNDTSIVDYFIVRQL